MSDDPSDPERAIREALARGERETAFEALYALYKARVLRHCRSMLRNVQQAEDAWQETWIQAYRDLESYAGKGTLRAWLLGIATHRCLDAARRNQVRVRHEVSLEELASTSSGNGEDAGPTTERVAVDGAAEILGSLRADEFSALLRRGIDELDAHDRAAVLLRHDSCLSYPEMAVLLDEAPATLEARVRRAMVKLRRSIERQGVKRHDL